jgi:hypothetical protein
VGQILVNYIVLNAWPNLNINSAYVILILILKHATMMNCEMIVLPGNSHLIFGRFGAQHFGVMFPVESDRLMVVMTTHGFADHFPKPYKHAGITSFSIVIYL